MRGRVDHFLELEKPEGLELKWRYFLFGTLLKKVSYSNNIFSVVIFILDFVFSLFPACYPIIGKAYAINGGKMSPGSAIFSHSQTMTYLTPTLISTTIWMNLVVVYYMLTMLTFTVSLAKPPLVRFWHWFLNCKVHQLFLPWVSGTVGFAIYAIIEDPEDLSTGKDWCVAVVVLFIPYLVIISSLFFIEANSVIRPEVTASEWFTMMPIFYPLLYVVINISSWQCLNMPRVCRITALVVAMAILLGLIVYLFVQMPLLLFVADEVFAGKYITMFCILFVAIFVTDDIWNMSNVVVAIVPTLCLFVLLITHFFFAKRRAKAQQILAQLDSTAGPATYESISSTLASLKNEVSLTTLVKEGLLTGNRAILSDAFIQYCLKKYPTNEWFLQFVTFVCSVIWSSDPDIYRFLLHLLSLDVFNLSTSFILFQYVYCHMQTSATTSPMVARRVMKLRKTRLEYVMVHKKFWSAAIDKDWKEFYQSNIQMFWIMLSMQSQMKTMEMMFPFSPIVRCELSLYYADFLHDPARASEEFRTANQIKNDKNYITNSLFKDYSLMLPAGKENEGSQKPVESHEYTFLSFQDDYTDANRYGVSLQVGDQYLAVHTSTFSMDRKSYSERETDQCCIWFLICVFVISSLLFVITLVISLTINRSLAKRKLDYTSVVDVGARSITCRENVVVTSFDIILLADLANGTYAVEGDTFDHAALYEYVVNHLLEVDQEILTFRLFFEANSLIRDIVKPFPNCPFVTGCTFSELLGLLRTTSNYFIASTVFRQTDTDLVQELDPIIEALIYWAYLLHINILEWIESKIKEVLSLTANLAGLASGELVWMLVAAISTGLITRSMSNSIFNVLATVQPPVLQSMACRFDKVIPQPFVAYPDDRKKRKPLVLPPLVIMFVALAMYPIGLILLLQTLDKTVPTHGGWSHPLQDAEISHYMYYARARLEMIMLSSEEAAGNYSCYHSMLTDTASNCSIHADFFEQLPIDSITSWVNIWAFVTTVMFAIFLRFAYLEVQFYRLAHQLLKEVPNRAVQSNRMFMKLLKGKQVTNNDVSEFMASLKTDPSDLSFFCILYLTPEGLITHVAGRMDEFISTIAVTLDELCEHLKANYSDNIDEINTFFAEQSEGRTLTLPRGPGSDMSLIFSSKPFSVIIYDDSHQAAVNARMRLAKRLSKLENPNLTPMQRAAVLMVSFGTKKELQILTSEMASLDIGTIIDTRNHIALVLVNGTEDEQKAANDCFTLIDRIRGTLTESKIVAHFGGPIQFFDSKTSRTVRSRCVGQCIDATRLLLYKSDIGAHITSDLFQAAGRDTSSLSFRSIRVADDITVDVTAI